MLPNSSARFTLVSFLLYDTNERSPFCVLFNYQKEGDLCSSGNFIIREMIVTELAIALLMVVTVIYFSHQLKLRRKKLPPGPSGLPLVGYLPFLNPKNPHLTLTELSEKFGGIYSLQLGSIFTVVLSDVKLVRQALALDSFSGRAPLYLTHGIMKGNGIICVQGEKWKEQRKFVVNCLRNFGMVKFGEKRNKMEADIKKGVRELVGKIKNGPEKEPIDVEPLLMHSLGNVVFNLVFGKTWDEEDETWKELIKLQEEGTKLIGVAGPINFLPFLRFLPRYRKVIDYIQNGIEYSHDIYQRILQNYRQTLATQADEENGEFRCFHFLGAFDREMMRRRNENSFYTKAQFNFLMADLWGAGVDTTITTLRWFFLYLAHHVEIQRKIQKEMDEVLGEREISLNDLTSLPLLQASLCEVQRIRSVTPLGIPHGTLEDSVLGGYDIPKGTMIVPLQWSIHMNPQHYPDPDVYNPGRFLDETGKFTKPDAFIPFQTGKRMCLGEEYARMLLLLYGGSVLQNFRLSLHGEVDFEGEVGITLTPKPHKIQFIDRKFENSS